MIQEPTIEKWDSFKVIGINYQGKNQNNEVPELWKQFIPRIQEIKKVSEKGHTFGVQWDHKDDGTFVYIAAIEVDAIDSIPEDMISWEIPEAEYVVFECTLSTLMEGYSRAHSWIKESEYKTAESPEFEYYPPSFDGTENSPMFIYIPIMK